MQMRSPVVLAFLLSLQLAAVSPTAAQIGHYRGFGDAGGFVNILPPGQDGVLNGPETVQAQAGTYPPHVKDQLAYGSPAKHFVRFLGSNSERLSFSGGHGGHRVLAWKRTPTSSAPAIGAGWRRDSP